MPSSEVTCWSIIEGAAGGSRASRDRFAEHYIPVIRAYLGTRWRLPDHDPTVVEACQEVLLECLKPEGPLVRADPERPGGFRAFLYGITRKVAQRIERREGGNRERQATSHFDLDEIARAEPTASEVFDRAWIEMLIQQAMDRLAARGVERWTHPIDRVALLQLRYDEGLPPREIAARQDLEVKSVYRALEQVRQEFAEEILQVLAFHNPAPSRSALEQRCIELLQSLR
ncbi:MAG: RNA polymerase sigma factor [Planctomycetota bacterium]|jgi:RNA polymerase sigma-70 factor (ECF subfamily)